MHVSCVQTRLLDERSDDGWRVSGCLVDDLDFRGVDEIYHV